MIKRIHQINIEKSLFKGKTIILYGARQVGKTTLVKKILNHYGTEGRYLNCEIFSVEQNLTVAEPEKLKAFFGDYKLIVLDEAQNLINTGKILKVISDSLTDIQIIATGSSSFDLANKTAEPMTGRISTFTLFPLSILEIKDNSDWLSVDAQLEKLLRFGSYPEVFVSNDESAISHLEELASSYLFKDILKFEGIKKSSLLKNLLISLALQLGNEVTYNELASKFGVSSLTIQKYIDLLEQSFVIFKLNSFSRNIRKELTKAFKIYFYDNGIRNALINNFNPIALRTDVGALWENFCISERIKSNSYSSRKVNCYFWRTYDQKEIDYIEERNGNIFGYEMKYSEKSKLKIPKGFEDAYNAKVFKIDKSNYWKFFDLQV
ncbi:MAG: ATP-binding protein [Ignavibacteriae bacterium]|nr:ATP-binding protein [Ignavibacteriota bacterium]NOG96375.1 ATP-binding protein [Ignavibacteriota bacterium]